MTCNTFPGISSVPIKVGYIDLWFTRPDEIREPKLLSAYYQLITNEERKRLQRYRCEKNRHTALITRAFIRTLLSKYANVPPEEWRFVAGGRGKPEIFEPPLPLRFNLSHTDNFIVCAVTLTHDIGVDIENTARCVDIDQLSRHFFSPRELTEFEALPQSLRINRFFDLWTLKESYLKASGEGIGSALNHFSFDCKNPHNIAITFSSQRKDNSNCWQNWLLSGSPEHRIAISVRAPGELEHQLRLFQTVPLQKVWRSKLPLSY